MSKNQSGEKIRDQLLEAVETAPFEAYKPQAIALQGDDFIVRLSDGDHEHVYLATRKSGGKQYSVIEVYPGVSVKHTHMRDVEPGEKDLRVPGRYTSIEAVVEMLTALWSEDMEPELKQLPSGDDNTNVRPLRAMPTKH